MPVDMMILFTNLHAFDQYLKDSIDRIINFFESNTVVSRAVALETAAAVQV